MSWEIVEGDCVEAMAAMPEASIDAVVTDPPYGLEFMGVAWDSLGKGGSRSDVDFDAPGSKEHPRTADAQQRVRSKANRNMQRFHERWAREALRVLKPGGHLLAFGGTRTYHRLVCAVEDAGFEVRDCIAWLYGSGFPKSLDVSKAIDKAAGAEREVVGRKRDPRYASPAGASSGVPMGTLDARANGAELYEAAGNLTAPATDAAREWQGWGTALKPAFEPIVVARKPLSGTVAATVLEHGTGALNVDGCRIDCDDKTRFPVGYDSNRNGAAYGEWQSEQSDDPAPDGRWPANVAFDEAAAAMLDEQTGERRGMASQRDLRHTPSAYFGADKFPGEREGYDDSGGASRFFYVAKASSAERNAGLIAGLPRARRARKRWQQDASGRWASRARNRHPTVKPVALMRWLVRLVTPPGGVVLDPFAGSGTTGVASVLEGFAFVGVERDAAYCVAARARIAYADRDPRAFVPEARTRRAAPRVVGLPTAEQLGFVDLDDEAVA